MLKTASAPAPAVLQRVARRGTPRRATVAASAAGFQSPAVKELRRLLSSPGIHLVRRDEQRARNAVRATAASASTRDPATAADARVFVQGPCAHDGLSARLIERAGFPFLFMSGFCVSASRLGAPDAGLISYGEMVDEGSLICAATKLPVIGDGDTGYLLPCILSAEAACTDACVFALGCRPPDC